MLREYSKLVSDNSFTEYDDYFARILRYIKINIKNNISLNDVAQQMDVSSRKITTDFQKYMGKTFITYLNEERIKYAIFLMNHSANNITKIALNSGFNDPNYFTKIFKMITGKTPRDYIKEHK